ncbi:MAG TPA: hypothetical protein VFP37_12510 [Steroidobacteraceae bacterium]|nr:hypothetical protein [Steroidobacteraceae bacterium]
MLKCVRTGNVGKVLSMPMQAAFPVLLLVLIGGCEAPPPSKFEQTFSKPDWFDSIEAPEVATDEEVSSLWQSTDRCCGNDENVVKNNRIFYKSCFNAISKHYEDETLVVECLWLMDVGAEREQKRELARFLVENYGDHRNRVDDCANCMPGDTVARVTLELARYESRDSNDKSRPIGRIENLLDRREDEISYWVQAEIYEFLGQLYLEAGVTRQRLDRYERAYARLDRLKDVNEPLNRRFGPIEKIRAALLAAERRDSPPAAN